MAAPLLGLIARLGAGAAGRGGARAASSVAARRVGSKVGKDAARRAKAQTRLNRMKRNKVMRGAKRGAKRFGREFLSGGMDSIGYRPGRNSGTERLMTYLGAGAGGGFDFNDPPLDTPQKVSPISNPSISSLEKQLKQLVETVTGLGIVTKKQQVQLLKDARKIEAAAKEQTLEQPDATPIAGPSVGDAIGPADGVVEKLITAIANLQEEIDNKVRDAQQNSFGNSFMEGFLDSLGLGGVKKARATKRAMPQVRKGFRQTRGGAFIDTTTGKYVKPEQALKNFKTVDPSHLSKAARARQATAVLGKSSSRVAGVLGSAIAKTKAGTSAAVKIGREAIAKVAKPLVAKSLAKTGLKSIPIVGAVAGGLFAIGRLLQGDVVGAGLEAASGLGGPLTAIPALVLSLARDVYSSVFGVQPETDPLVGQRMGMVKNTVEDLAKEALSKKVEAPAKAPMPAQKTAAIPPPPSAPPAAPAASQVSAPGPASTAPAPAGGGGGGGTPAPSAGGSGGTPAPSAGGGAAPAPADGGGAPAAAPEPGASGGTPQQVAAETTSKKLEGEEGSAPSAAGTAPEVKSLTGEKILQASTEQPPTPAAMGMTGSAPPKPATLPTTKGRAKGMGDVPEPTYLNLGSIAKQLYFGSVAGVMAS